VRAFAHDSFTYPLPAGHRFPLAKYRLVRERAARLTGVDLEQARAATWEELALAHAPDYLDCVRSGTLDRREQLALGLPWSLPLVERARRSTGATLQASAAALTDGTAMNLGGGTHHAFAASGRGFCLLNDVVCAARSLRAAGHARRFVVIDLDVHQGDGTHALCAGDPDTFTFSINGFRNYPFKRVPGDLELELPDDTGDDVYLDGLGRLLPEALRRARPDLAFYLAGADPFAGDRLGRLALTKRGLRDRDALVRDGLRAAGIPVCVTLAGGYAEDILDTVEINASTVETFAVAA
jgi:acetoin utilization deacetylase AcuC-like enzyme